VKGGQGKGGWVGGGAEMQELVSRPLSWVIRKCAVVPAGLFDHLTQHTCENALLVHFTLDTLVACAGRT